MKQTNNNSTDVANMLVGLGYKSLMPYARKLTLNQLDAEDLVSTTFLRCIEKADKYNHSGTFKAWVYTVMYNTFVNMYRRNERHPETEFEEKHIKDVSYQINKLDKNILYKILRTLPDNFKACMLLRFKFDYKYEEIAKFLDLEIGTVKSKIHFGRVQFNSQLTEYSMLSKEERIENLGKFLEFLEKELVLSKKMSLTKEAINMNVSSPNIAVAVLVLEEIVIKDSNDGSSTTYKWNPRWDSSRKTVELVLDSMGKYLKEHTSKGGDSNKKQILKAARVPDEKVTREDETIVPKIKSTISSKEEKIHVRRSVTSPTYGITVLNDDNNVHSRRNDLSSELHNYHDKEIISEEKREDLKVMTPSRLFEESDPILAALYIERDKLLNQMYRLDRTIDFYKNGK